MKKLLFLLLSVLSLTAFAAGASDARKVLDKSAAVISNKKGAQAQFTITGDKMKSSGTIYIKGVKFHATTADGAVWYNGKTQWSYLKSTDEVNITTPTKEQQAAINPMTFINLYKRGYDLSMKTSGQKYEVTLKAQGAKSGVQEMVVTIDKTTYVPLQVKMRQKQTWLTIKITHFQTTSLADSLFVFTKQKAPGAEIVDLR